MKYEMPRGSFGGDHLHGPTTTPRRSEPGKHLKNHGYPADPSKLPGKLFESDQLAHSVQRSERPSTVDPKPEADEAAHARPRLRLQHQLRRWSRRCAIPTAASSGRLKTSARSAPKAKSTTSPILAKAWLPIPRPGSAGFPTTPEGEFATTTRSRSGSIKRICEELPVRGELHLSRVRPATTAVWPAPTRTARTSPNVNRYFDLPWLGYTEKGVMADGALATDRPHTFKFFGGYTAEEQARRHHAFAERRCLLRHPAHHRDQRDLVASGVSLRPRRPGPDSGLLQLRHQPDARLQPRSQARRTCGSALSSRCSTCSTPAP